MKICRYVWSQAPIFGVLLLCLALAGCLLPQEKHYGATGAGGNLTENLSANITTILFNATTFVQKNVTPANQTNVTPLMNVTNSGNVTKAIKCNASPTISGVSIKAAMTYNASAALPCNVSAPSIGNLTGNNSTGLWFWANFYFPLNRTANVTINITGG